uniref:Large ribosomal subunit protein uL2m n=1 Tax=Cyanidium sp. THAL103 TaxID=3027999 RepID=A0A9Y1I496_9RHOD|nr:ribosomal protein L2 [Cyanidium sp. THAL103]
MILKTYKSHTPGTRNLIVNVFKNLTNKSPSKTLSFGYSYSKGRNVRGIITSRHKGGGHKKKYRIIDFKRNKYEVPAKVTTIEYDPNRSALISLLNYVDGEKRYILYPNLLSLNSEVISGEKSPLELGNSLPLYKIPLGVQIHNIELNQGKGGQIARSAGASAQIIGKSSHYATLKLPSGEIRLIFNKCFATLGQVSNLDHSNVTIGKAGRKRWLGIRPSVRGLVMNPVDHPHGGGEGKSPVGRKKPVTPWGKPTLGYKTRRKKLSDKYILKRR